MLDSFYQLSYDELSSKLANIGLNPNAAKIVFDKIYKFKNTSISNTPNQLFEKLSVIYDFKLPKIKTANKSEDGTIKFLIEFHDGKCVETVLIPFFKKYTVCLSSQVGCAMNCSFCFTGTQGLSRNLKSAEIISQYLLAFQYLKENIDPNAKIPNIVFMGQGEPLHNFEELKKALNLLLDKRAFHLGSRQITVSSAGFIPGLKRFNELFNVNLAISFHSAINEMRSALIPINKTYPIEDLIDVLSKVHLLKRQFITFEYLLIDQMNNDEESAKLLSEVISPLKSIVNLIPFNPIPGSIYQRPTADSVMQFKAWLVSFKVRTMVRTTKGDEIMAACGQLNSKTPTNLTNTI